MLTLWYFWVLLPTAMATNVTVPPDYQINQQPMIPLTIETTFLPESVSNLDPEAQTITLSLKIGLKWPEPRLKITNLTDEEMTEIKPVGKIWTPDLEIFYLQNLELINAKPKFSGYYEHRTQNVLVFIKLVGQLFCPSLNFIRFPFDQHVCSFKIRSTSLPADKFKIVTERISKPEVDELLKGFDIKIVNLTTSTLFQSPILDFNMSVAGFEIQLQRQPWPYIWAIFIPSGSMVIISWLSFLIPADSYPGRGGLLLTTFLVLINIFMGVMLSKGLAPISDGVNFMVAWLLSCIFFVFSALLVFAWILLQKRLASISRNNRCCFGPLAAASEAGCFFNENNVDSVALLLFPSFFTIFVAVFTFSTICH